MILISWKSVVQGCKKFMYANQWRQNQSINSNSTILDEEIDTCRTLPDSSRSDQEDLRRSDRGGTTNNMTRNHETNSIIRQSQHNPSSVFNSMTTQKEVLTQACLFILAMVTSLLFSTITRTCEAFTGELPFWSFLIARILYPMQGLLNILVYTRPHVISVRKRSPHYSWRKAFWIVVQRGGDHGGLIASRRQRRVRRLSWISRQNPQFPFTTINTYQHTRSDDIIANERSRSQNIRGVPNAHVKDADRNHMPLDNSLEIIQHVEEGTQIDTRQEQGL